jgi:hypothetical protein
MTVPFAFANLSGNIALSKLDSNFNTPITIGNTSVQLGNTITTINNVTLANVTITSGTSNVTNVNVTSINVTNLTATLANITTLNVASSYVTASNVATAVIGNLTLSNALTVPNGGTGRVTLPVNNVLLGNGTGSLTSVAPGNAGNVLTSIGGVWVSNAAVASGGGTGTVTNVSVVSGNGFSGTVANSTSNAAITLSATFNGIAWANATGVLSNVAVGTGLSFSNTTGVLTATGAVANAVTSVGNTYPILSTGGTTPTISFVAPGTAGNVLTSIGGIWVSNASVSAGGGVTSVSASSPIASSGGSTPNISLTGTVAVANGGTGLTATPTNGQIDIGNGSGFTRTTLTAGTNVTITNGAGSITIAASGGGGGSPGGSDTQVQYNSSSTFAGSANLTFNGTTLNAASINVSTGNLTFTTTGQKIVGDFTNATVSNRTNFVTSTANSSTGIYALPSGTSTAASWQAANNSDPTNASKVLIASNGSTDVQLVSGVNGTGTYLPLAFYNGGAGRFVVGTSGEFGIGPTATVSYGTAGQPFISSGASAAPVYGTLTPVGGGTGLATIPSGNVILGNGTSAVAVVAPGTAGNVLTSIGGVWTSNAAVSGGSPGGSTTQFQYNNAGSFAGAANLTTDGANVTIGSANTLRFANLTSTRYVGFRANAIVAANVTWTLPVSDGSSNQFLKTDGTGTLSWGSAATASPILESYQTISSNYTITSGSNGFSVGPVTIATGVSVTVPTGQVWLIAA